MELTVKFRISLILVSCFFTENSIAYVSPATPAITAATPPVTAVANHGSSTGSSKHFLSGLPSDFRLKFANDEEFLTAKSASILYLFTDIRRQTTLAQVLRFPKDHRETLRALSTAHATGTTGLVLPSDGAFLVAAYEPNNPASLYRCQVLKDDYICSLVASSPQPSTAIQ